ncbi:MAG: hypothetical protein WAV93_05230 [Bacteroidales bacterium]
MKTVRQIAGVLLMAAISVTAAAQGTVVTGIITDDREVPVTGALACQINTTNCAAADLNGIFHLLLEPGKERNLKVECPGFNPVEVVIDETTVSPVRVTLTPAYVPQDGGIDFSDRRAILRSTLGLDAVFTDFTEFAPDLGLYNTDVMDYFAVVGPELGASLSGFYFGFGFGFGYSYRDDHDTLIVDLNNTMYKLNLGYDLVSSTRLRITPLISFRWLRFRLENYPAERKITLETYLDERDLDLRFNQTIAVAGLNMEYIMYSGAPGNSDYWSFGLEGGYAVKLNQKPWTYSRGNRIMSDNTIGLKHMTFGLRVTYYTIIR